MSAITVLAVQILAVAALPVQVPPPGVLAPPTNLRGVSAPAPAPAPAASNQTVDERGPRGHFYYADKCEDCFYKGAQCGCQATVEYFACLTKHCHSSDGSKFAAKCAEVSTSCSTELDVACRGPDSSCKGKYNQLPTGGVGLTLDLDGVDDDAFCGPFGKCTGVVHMKAHIHNPFLVPNHGEAFFECGLPIVPDADVDDQTQWTLCRAQLMGDKAGCDLPMFPELKAGEGKDAYCVLTQGTVGNPPKRLTQPVWHKISNTHDKVPSTTTTNGGFWVK